ESEDALVDWLEEQGVADAARLAEALAAAGVQPEHLAPLARRADGEELAKGLAWLAARLEIATLLDEAGRGAARIADTVKAMKSYSYMDQAPRQEVDVHEGIEDTLTILRHKLKYGIEVTRDYDKTLPRLNAYGS